MFATKGFYYNFVDTIQPLKMLEWNTNEIILVNVVGSACGVCDVNSMVVVKLVRCNVLVFYKGDPKKDKRKLS
jgi:hypothetical protein